MHTRKEEQHQPLRLNDDQLERLNRVRVLTDDLNLENAEDADRARNILREHDLPDDLLYTLRHVPVTEAAKQWAERRAQELQDDGLVR